jgi:hypothetical protein
MRNTQKVDRPVAQHNVWTLEKLEKRTASERHQLYKNAAPQGGPDAEELLRLIEGAGLPYSDDVALRNRDPIAEKIAEIAYSEEARAAMLEAVAAGRPPMAGLDPLLSQALGADYGRHNISTKFAARIVAERMGQLGYRKTGKKAVLPAGCVAKTADLMTADAAEQVAENADA